MFILKREDVEIVNARIPNQERKVPILKYNGQTFRLLKVFPVEKAEDAMNYWRDWADNQHKFCILLEETERYTIWGKVKIAPDLQVKSNNQPLIPLIQASLLLLQNIHLDIEDLLGTRQGEKFIQDIYKLSQNKQFPEINSPQKIEHLLRIDPLEYPNLPPWQEEHLIILLQESYRLGKHYFGNTRFAESTKEIIRDLPLKNQEFFLYWLEQKSLNKLWF